MKARRIVLAIGTLLIAGTPACNINVPAPAASAVPQVATAVAQTLQAAAQTALASPAASPGSSSPILTVGDNTNCRAGPSTNYQILSSIPAGTSVPILGRDPASTFWLVQPPNGAERCWVRIDLGTTSGSLAGIPEATQSATAAKAPAMPVYLFYKFTCPSGNLQTVLTWSDSADNEAGYRVYRYGVLIAELPANSTTYTDHTTIAIGGTINYSVTSFNSAGESAFRTESFHCP